MCPSRDTLNTQKSQRGIGIPAALFVITLLAILAVAVNSLVEQNAETYQEEVSLSRAFYAAESGAGFALNSIFPPEEFPQYSGTAECAAGPREYEFNVTGLNECTASVTCTLDATVAGVDYFTVKSVASCDGVTRTVQVRTSR